MFIPAASLQVYRIHYSIAVEWSLNISEIQGGRSPVPDDSTIGNLEVRIRALCSRVIESGSEDELRTMCAELRSLLSEHIAVVRLQARALKAKMLDIKKQK